MKVILFGATGMVGQGVLRECLLAPDVTAVLAVGRAATGETHPKLRELVDADLFDYSGVTSELAGYDACFFCLGVSAAGMTEEAYSHITYDLTLAAAQTLVKLNPAMTFLYVSGAGTNGSEKAGAMWARVKGKTENALLRLPFKRVVMLRPGLIQPLHGIKSKTPLYRAVYRMTGPLLPMLKAVLPNAITTTEDLARAMIEIARHGVPKPVLEMRDLVLLAKAPVARA